jgi:K+-sensing histidine kinase KdpD
VQEFVQAHGGSIELVDGEFAGAHFRVRLPVHPSTRPAQDGQAAPAAVRALVERAS